MRDREVERRADDLKGAGVLMEEEWGAAVPQDMKINGVKYDSQTYYDDDGGGGGDDEMGWW